MGTWGAGPFENDEAVHWLAALVESPDAAPLFEVLGAVADLAMDDELDAPESQLALAAAEVVAAARGCPAETLPIEASRWVGAHAEAGSRPLAILARRAVSRVAQDSELKDLWDEALDGRQWEQRVVNLLERLQDRDGR